MTPPTAWLATFVTRWHSGDSAPWLAKTQDDIGGHQGRMGALALTVSHDYAAISLPAIPGVNVTADRTDTDPRQPTIRTAKQPRGAIVGAAARQQALTRVAMFRAALIEAMEGRA